MYCQDCRYFVPAKGDRDSHCTGPGTYDATPDPRWNKKQLKEWFDYGCYNAAKEGDPGCRVFLPEAFLPY